MKNAATFQAAYADWRLVKTRSCVQIVFELPLEAANEAYAALGGMPNPAAESWFAIARLVQPTGKGVEAETTDASPQLMPALVKPPARAPRNKLAQLAGMLSKTPLFHRYMEAKIPDYVDVNEETAAEFIRLNCNVRSRSEIIAGTHAGDNFLVLYDDYIIWSEADKFVEAL